MHARTLQERSKLASCSTTCPCYQLSCTSCTQQTSHPRSSCNKTLHPSKNPLAGTLYSMQHWHAYQPLWCCGKKSCQQALTSLQLDSIAVPPLKGADCRVPATFLKPMPHVHSQMQCNHVGESVPSHHTNQAHTETPAGLSALVLSACS